MGSQSASKWKGLRARFAAICCAVASAATMLAQAPDSSPPAPLSGQRPSTPTGTIAPPGFSRDLPPRAPGFPAPAARSGAAAEPAASAAFSPETARVGWPVEYRVTLVTDAPIQELPRPIAPAGLELDSARGVSPQAFSGQIVSTFRFSARALHPGRFTIPSFPVQVAGKVVNVPAATLVATEGDPRDAVYQPVRAVIDIPKRDFFIGESIDARVLFFETADEQPQFIQHVVKSSGPVLFKPNPRSRSENIIWEGKAVRALIMPVEITPLVPGEAEVNCQVIVHVSRSNLGGRGILSQSTIDVPSARFRVLPLPPVRPAGFTGGIGQFTLAQPRLSATEAEIGEPIVMTVALTGEGNLDGVPPPQLEESADWNAYRPTSEVQREGDGSGGTKLFTYTLVPKQEGRQGTPAIPFAYFDPVKKTFVDVTIPPQPVLIKPSSAPVPSATAANASESSAPSEPPRDVEPTLTGLAETTGAWHTTPGPNLKQFLWLQLIPPVILLGLWGWRRRTEYLERHPEILRRRAARANARKALSAARAAARRGDSAAFFEASLGALRQAAAPLDSAEAESLTREEVLRQLRSDERAARAARAIFETADASRYASIRSAELAESAKLLPDLEHAVSTLSMRR